LPETGALTGRRECGIRACECFCETETIRNASDTMRVAETQPPFQNAKANEKPTSHISPCRSGCLPLSVSASGRENFHPLAASLLRIWQAASSKGHAALIDGCKDCKHGQGECRMLVSLGFPWIPLDPPRLDGVSKDPSTQFFPRNRLKCPWILNLLTGHVIFVGVPSPYHR